MLGKFLDPLADKLTRERGAGVHGRARPRAGVGRRRAHRRAISPSTACAASPSAQGLVIAASDGGKIKTALQLVAIMMLLISLPLSGAGRRHRGRLPRRRAVAAVPVDGRVAVFGRAVHAALPVGGAQAVARDDVIAVPAAPLAPDEAARRAAPRRGRVLAVVAGADEVGIARDLVGAAPVARRARRFGRRIWRARAGVGGGARGLGARRARRRAAGIPAAVGWFSYDLGRRVHRLAARAPATVEPPWPLVEFHFHDAVWVRDADGAATIFAPRRGGGARGWRTLLARPAPRPRRSRLGPLTADHADARFSRRRRARAGVPARGRRLPGEPVAPAVGDVRAGRGDAGRAGGGAARARARAPRGASSRRRTATARWSATRPSGSWPSTADGASRRGRSRGRGRAATRPTADRRGGGGAGARRRRTGPSTS